MHIKHLVPKLTLLFSLSPKNILVFRLSEERIYANHVVVEYRLKLAFTSNRCFFCVHGKIDIIQYAFITPTDLVDNLALLYHYAIKLFHV